MCEQEYSAEYPCRPTQYINDLDDNFVEMFVISIGSAENQYTVTNVMNEENENTNKPHVHKIRKEYQES